VGGDKRTVAEEEMKEYTLFASLAAVIVVALDLFVLKTRVTTQKAFWFFVLVMYGFMTLVNGYLTWRPIVLYNDPFYFGIRLYTIPVEDYVYGFALMGLSVVLWEWFKVKMKSKK
jgi:lycopene cyclase domain-containing protein